MGKRECEVEVPLEGGYFPLVIFHFPFLQILLEAAWKSASVKRNEK